MEHLKHFYNHTREHHTRFQIVPCPQKLNWHEMPLFVQFANDLGVKLHFSIALREPYGVCIWNSSSDELKNVLKELEKYRFGGNSSIEIHNQTIFEDFIRSVEMWIKSAEAKEQRQRRNLSSKKDFKKMIRRKVSDLIDENNRQGFVIDDEEAYLIKMRTEELLASLPPNYDVERIFVGFSTLKIGEAIPKWLKFVFIEEFRERLVCRESPYS